MYETTYHRAASLSEAQSAMSQADDGKYLAGGQTLIATMKQRLAAPSDVIDISRLAELQGIEAGADSLTIGAATTHAEVAGSSAVRGSIAALAELAGHIGDPHVRYVGTLGGSVANNDPAADYPAAVLGLDGTVHTDQRAIAAGDFFTGLFETALADNEIITRISFTVPQSAAYEKFANPASRYAMVGVLVAKMKDGSVRVAVTGAGDNGVFRSAALESALAGSGSADAVDSVAVDAGGILSDIHGSAAYRAHLVTVMAKRAAQRSGWS